MSGRKSAEECTYFEDGTVELKPGMLPDTYTFKCPGGMCSGPDKNNNNEAEAAAAPQIRQIPKTDLSKCPAPVNDKKTVDQCEEEKPKLIEDSPPPITTKLPETKSFQCSESMKKDQEDKGAEKSESTIGEVIKTCGISLGGGAKRNCKCGTPLPPIPKPKPCGCNGKGAGAFYCGPNTSCEVTPLTMKKSK